MDYKHAFTDILVPHAHLAGSFLSYIQVHRYPQFSAGYKLLQTVQCVFIHLGETQYNAYL